MKLTGNTKTASTKYEMKAYVLITYLVFNIALVFDYFTKYDIISMNK